MKVKNYETREEWLGARLGKITGTRSRDVMPAAGPTKEMICEVLEKHDIDFKKSAKKEELEVLLSGEMHAELYAMLPKKIGFYELVAERIAAEPDNGESPMDRGQRLEGEAIAVFEKKTKKKVDTSLKMWFRDDNESIAVSPDGQVSETEAVEVKCLSSARHIEAFWTKEIPAEYDGQMVQYFLVNTKLQKLYFCFYDPRIPQIDFFYIEVTRKQVAEEVEKRLQFQRLMIEDVERVVNELTF